MKATLQDIADKTGLSVSTISRVLRGESKTATGNVELIIRTAQSLNYPVNTRLLNSAYNFKKTLSVAVITNFVLGEFYSMLCHGLSGAAQESNVLLSLHDFTFDESRIVDYLRHLSNNSVDAVILFLPTLKEHHYYQILEEMPKDFIVISIASVFHPLVDTISFDSYRGGFLVAKHFAERCYTDVGLITGPVSRHEALLRKSGYTDFIEHNSSLNLVWQYEGDYSVGNGKRAYHAYKNAKQKPRAIFSSNDSMCLGFIEQAQKDGLRIPQDIAIAGYDDLPVCEYLFPTLTSVRTDYKELGQSAFNMIKEKVEKGEGHRGVFNMMPVSLAVRNST